MFVEFEQADLNIFSTEDDRIPSIELEYASNGVFDPSNLTDLAQNSIFSKMAKLLQQNDEQIIEEDSEGTEICSPSSLQSKDKPSPPSSPIFSDDEENQAEQQEQLILHSISANRTTGKRKIRPPTVFTPTNSSGEEIPLIRKRRNTTVSQ